MTPQKPSIGRIVHYVGANLQHYPAIIVIPFDPPFDNDTLLSVFGLATSGEACSILADYQEQPSPGSWHWPERE